jgi:hypothetical protein
MNRESRDKRGYNNEERKTDESKERWIILQEEG